MKKLLLALFFVATPVLAESWYIANEGNGEIVITTDKCKYENGLKHAYLWTPQVYYEGCWGVVDNNVHIVWVRPDNTRARKVYRITDFAKKESY